MSRSLILLTAAALTACSTPTSTVDAREPARLLVWFGLSNADSSHTRSGKSGDRFATHYEVRDGFGHPVAAPIPTFVTRDSTIATVDVVGTVTAVGTGFGVIVGTIHTAIGRTLTDSIILSSVACTLEARPAINIAAQDSLNGAAVALSNVVFTVRDGTYADSASVAASTPGAPASVGLAYERAGTYDITVRATGYRTWSATGVAVSKNICHVNTVQILALLVRQ